MRLKAKAGTLISMQLIIVLITLISIPSWAWDSTDFKSELLSPVKTEAKWAFYSGLVLTTTFILLEEQTDGSHDEIVEDKPLGSFSGMGDVAGQMVPNILYMAYQWSYGKNERAQGMFKATMYATGWTTILKYSIQEPRPNDHRDRNSFPSGHTTTASAFASYVAAEHGWHYGLPAGILAGFVGLSRINDNKHRLHDVVAGATIGTAYGWGIQQTDHIKSKRESVTFFPIIDTQTVSFVLVKQI